MSTSNTNLYAKSLLVRMANSKPSEDRFKLINITVDYQTSNIPKHKTELIIKLTDEKDPFFLYSLFLTEEDYPSLKASQGLLVDFNAFGQILIDLLKKCDNDSQLENPKANFYFKRFQLILRDSLINNTLEVVEISPFKHLCHLSLSFSPGNDNDVKSYLAGCLQKHRDEYAKLKAQYEHTLSELKLKTDSTQKALTQKDNEIERLKVELGTSSEQLAQRHSQELNFERERAAQAQFAQQQKFEKEKRELEASTAKTIKQIETRLSELELENKELAEKKYRHETQIQELTYRNTTLQEDLQVTKSELSQFKKQNTALDSQLHSNEKQINHLSTRIGLLEQEIKDKQDALIKTQESLMTEQCQRKQLEETLKERSSELKKKQLEITHYIEEFRKGNEVIEKLTQERNKLSTQLRVKSKIVVEQEKKVDEKEREIARINAELTEIKKQVASLIDENGKLSTALQKKSADYDELTKKADDKEKLINYYNKQLNHQKLAFNDDGAGSASSLRGYGNLLSTNNHFINNNLSPAASGFMGASAMGKPPSAVSPTGIANINAALASELDLSANPRLGSAFGSAKNPLVSTSSSSLQHQHIDHSKENLETPVSLSSRAENLKLSSAPAPGVAKLDPKYFHNPQMNLNNMGVSGGGFDLQKKQLQGPAVANNLSKGGFIGMPTVANHGANLGVAPMAKPTKTTPPLASAYFP